MNQYQEVFFPRDIQVLRLAGRNGYWKQLNDRIRLKVLSCFQNGGLLNGLSHGWEDVVGLPRIGKKRSKVSCHWAIIASIRLMVQKFEINRHAR